MVHVKAVHIMPGFFQDSGDIGKPERESIAVISSLGVRQSGNYY
jgi:hypothetical protein